MYHLLSEHPNAGQRENEISSVTCVHMAVTAEPTTSPDLLVSATHITYKKLWYKTLLQSILLAPQGVTLPLITFVWRVITLNRASLLTTMLVSAAC